MTNRPLSRPPAVRRPLTVRDADQRQQVEHALRDQVAQLEVRLSTDIEQNVIERLVGERRRRRDLPTIQVLDQHHHPVLAASGEVLARVADLSPAKRRALGAEEIAGLPGILRVPGDPADAQRLGLRPNFVTPMGIVMKALCGPEPAGDVAPTRLTSGRGTPLQVAVIDTGISSQDRTDQWLAGLETDANVDTLFPLPPTGFLGLGAGHGTFVAGIIQQLAPDADIRVYRALQPDGLGTEVEVALTLLRAVADGADIVNLSLGLETTDDQPPIALEAAVALVARDAPDVLLIAAAGNTGRNRKCWPGAFDDVTAVGGLTVGMRPATWSTHGSWVDCSTLGEGVMSTYVTGEEDPMVDDPGDVFGGDPWALWSGTSFAAPQIAGAVAQVAQRQGLRPRDSLAHLLRRRRHVPDYGRMVRLLRPASLDGPVQFVG